MLPLQAAPGFIACRLFKEVDEADTICYVEEWRTAYDLNRQIRTSHYTRLMSLMEGAAEPPVLRMNWITDVKGLEYVELVRGAEPSL